MSLKQELQNLVIELDLIKKREGLPDRGRQVLPTMRTAKNGVQQFYSQKSIEIVKNVTRIIYGNRSCSAIPISLDDFGGNLLQAITDFYSEGKLQELLETEGKSVIQKLKEHTETLINNSVDEYTHYFAAWTIGFEKIEGHKIGPVHLMTREQWINELELDKFGDFYTDNSKSEGDIKRELRLALSNKLPPEADLCELYKYIEDASSVLKITISGHEKNYSRKLGKLICKTALDSTSLLLGGKGIFIKQALREERLPPWEEYSLMANNDFMSMGLSKGERNLFFSSENLDEAFQIVEVKSKEIANVLQALLRPESHKVPMLINRWITALNWFVEGSRDESDAIALVKFGTCLDVLSDGGEFKGILEMVSRMLSISENEIVFESPQKITLRNHIKAIYNDRRSKILHGNHCNPLASLEQERSRAALVARSVLIHSLNRLMVYEGPDDRKAFRKLI